MRRFFRMFNKNDKGVMVIALLIMLAVLLAPWQSVVGRLFKALAFGSLLGTLYSLGCLIYYDIKHRCK